MLTEDYDDFYVDLLKSSRAARPTGNVTRREYPLIKDVLSWGVVKAGDIIQAKNRDDEGTLLENGNILVDGEEMSLASWLKGVLGWQSVKTYVFSIHKETGKSLDEIREKYMEREGLHV